MSKEEDIQINRSKVVLVASSFPPLLIIFIFPCFYKGFAVLFVATRKEEEEKMQYVLW